MTTMLLIHAAATLYMTGVIWFVQVVHYPLMAAVGRDGFAAYESRHTRLTSWVVMPPMLVELATAMLLVGRPPAGLTRALPSVGLALLVLVWLSTFSLQVPAHRKLEESFDAAAHARLVTTNWIRTVAWSARSLIVVWMVATIAG